MFSLSYSFERLFRFHDHAIGSPEGSDGPGTDLTRGAARFSASLTAGGQLLKPDRAKNGQAMVEGFIRCLQSPNCPPP